MEAFKILKEVSYRVVFEVKIRFFFRRRNDGRSYFIIYRSQGKCSDFTFMVADGGRREGDYCFLVKGFFDRCVSRKKIGGFFLWSEGR